MHRRTLTALGMLIAATAAWGQGIAWSNVGFGLSSYPEENGNVTEGYLSYRFSPTWSALAEFRSTVETTGEEITTTAVLERSLNLARLSLTEVFVYPVGLRFDIGLPLSVYAGVYYGQTAAEEVGFFTLIDDGYIFTFDGPFSFESDMSLSVFGPAVQVGATLEFEPLTAYLQAMAIPFFHFSSSQETLIDPLFGAAGTATDSGFGAPMLSAKADLALFNLLGLKAMVDYFRIQRTLVEASSDGTAWVETDYVYGTTTLTMVGSVRIPLFDRGSAEIGYGRRLQWLKPGTEAAIFSNRGTLSITFSIAK